MKDGSTIIGELILDTEEKLIVKTSSMGEITILKTNMTSFRILNSSQKTDGVYLKNIFLKQIFILGKHRNLRLIEEK